jgi:hypothetical protein
VSDLERFQILVEEEYPLEAAREFGFYDKVVSVLQAYDDTTVVVEEGVLKIARPIHIGMLSGATGQLMQFVNRAGTYGISEKQLVMSLDMTGHGKGYAKAALAACLAVGSAVAKSSRYMAPVHARRV